MSDGKPPVSAAPAPGPAAPRAIVTSMETPRRIGLTIFTLVFGVFGLWAAVAPLDGAAFGLGRVTVRSHKKIVQHLEGGIVAEIMARNGDLVEIGQPLLVLDDTQPLANLEIANSQFIALKVREARLVAERDGLDRPAYPESLSRTDPRAGEEIAAQDEIFRARRTANEGRDGILRQRISQLESQLEGMAALKTSREALAASFAEELADTRTLLERGFSEKTRLRELERSVAMYEGEAAELTSNIAATEVQVGETRLQILQQRSEFHNEVVSELAEVQTSLADLSERINALEDVVGRTVVASPEAGLVNGMQVHTVGGVVAPGSPIAEIVPESDELVIDVNISSNDIDRVSEGQEARVRFTTFGSAAPTIFGTVLSLSADSVVDEATGAAFYQTRITVDPDGMEELGGVALQPGMTAEVFINTGSRTFLQYLFRPFSNAMARSFNED